MIWQFVALIATTLGPGEGPSQEPAVAPPTGHLVVVGGGPIDDAIRRRILGLAGGPKARVVVVSQATREPLVWGAQHAEQWKKAGAGQAAVLDVADARKAVALIESADLIWISGGSQKRLVQALAGTGVPEAIYTRYAQGATVAGTSAGAAAMSRVMIVGYQPRAASGERLVEIADGLGLWPEVIVDQHFVKRKRQKRLQGVIVTHPDLIGVGIDESTALVVDSVGKWTVIGASAAIVYDARHATITPAGAKILGATGLTVHVLPSGSRYDPSAAHASLP